MVLGPEFGANVRKGPLIVGSFGFEIHPAGSILPKHANVRSQVMPIRSGLAVYPNGAPELRPHLLHLLYPSLCLCGLLFGCAPQCQWTIEAPQQVFQDHGQPGPIYVSR